MTNFDNGALVFRLWRQDGSGEIVGKFAYMNDAKTFAAACMRRDEALATDDAFRDYFYLAVCECMNEVQAYPSEARDA